MSLHYVITGASRGIGFEIARHVLEQGHQVTALVRAPARADALIALQSKAGGRLKTLQVDVTDSRQIAQAADDLGVRGLPIDVLINNAGVLLDRSIGLSELDPQDIIKSFEVNALAPLALAQAVLPMLEKSKQPKLVNITSLMGSIGDNGSGGYYAYRMSKAALNMFAKSFSIDFPKIITLNLHPGWVRTEMGGAQAPLAPRDSAAGLLKVIANAGQEQSGHFYDFEGEELPW